MKKVNNIRKLNKRLYSTWKGIRQRCLNKKNKQYNFYGGRGIKICKRWDKFENFLSDMGNRPKLKSLDRINNDGDYKPSNCRWATKKEQALNRRSNVYLKYKGESKTISEWAEFAGFKFDTLWMRLKRGHTIKEAIERKLYSKKN